MLERIIKKSGDVDPHQLIADQLIETLQDVLPTLDGDIATGSNKVTLADLDKNIEEALVALDYNAAILNLWQRIDLNNGVEWSIHDTVPRQLLIRDARRISKAPILGPEPYLIMSFNNIRALKELLIAEGCPLIKSTPFLNHLNRMALTLFFQTIKMDEAAASSKMKDFNSHMVEFLTRTLDISQVDALKRIDVAKEFANFLDDSKDIVTLITLKDKNGKDVIAFQSAIVQSSLTTDLLDEYVNRQSKDWYIPLAEWKKQLIEHNLPTLIKGNHVIPTQLRKTLPGLRNVYRSINGLISTDYQTVNITLDVYHSGTIAFLGKNADEKTRVTKLNAGQLQKFAEGKQVLGLILNTKVPGFSLSNAATTATHEAIIVEKSAIGMDTIKGLYVNLPINYMRGKVANTYDGIYTLFEYVNAFFIPKIKDECDKATTNSLDYLNFFEKIPAYLVSGKDNVNGLNKRVAEIAVIKEYFKGLKNEVVIPYCDIVELALKIIGVISNNGKLKSDENNKNLHLASYTLILTAKMSRFLNLTALLTCASGKDRTGLGFKFTVAVSFTHALMNTYEFSSMDPKINDIILQNITTLVRARHQATLAGFQGACGTPGIKEESAGAIPKEMAITNILKQLIEPYSAFNKKPQVSNGISKLYYPLATFDINDQRASIRHALGLLILAQEESKADAGYFLKLKLDRKVSLLKKLQNELTMGYDHGTLKVLVDKALNTEKAIDDKGNTYRLLKAISDNLGGIILYDVSVEVRDANNGDENINVVLGETHDNFDDQSIDALLSEIGDDFSESSSSEAQTDPSVSSSSVIGSKVSFYTPFQAVVIEPGEVAKEEIKSTPKNTPQSQF